MHGYYTCTVLCHLAVRDYMYVSAIEACRSSDKLELLGMHSVPVASTCEANTLGETSQKPLRDWYLRPCKSRTT